LEIWRFGDLEIWRFGDLEIWRFSAGVTAFFLCRRRLSERGVRIEKAFFLKIALSPGADLLIWRFGDFLILGGLPGFFPLSAAGFIFARGAFGFSPNSVFAGQEF
jgi:hypothetical protein